MLNTIILGSVAMAGAAMAAGSAIVVNSCSYDVNLAAVPASGGGATESDKTLSSGDKWSQEWTSLTNGAGWSIKLAQNNDWSNIMQYEYTWGGSGTIWYDLSDVNGNPWNGDWEITADDGCSPRQAAYRYATDDAYGEQSCDGSASITVTLCSGSGMQNQTGTSSSSAASSAASTESSSSVSTAASTESSSSAAPLTTSSSSSSSAPATTSSVASTSATLLSENPQSSGAFGVGFANDKVAAGKAETVQSTHATTFVTSNRGGVTVTEVATHVVTNVVTATAHAHQRRHQHHKHA